MTGESTREAALWQTGEADGGLSERAREGPLGSRACVAVLRMSLGRPCSAIKELSWSSVERNHERSGSALAITETNVPIT